MPSIKEDAPVRSVMEVGAGDFIKVGSQWREIRHNTATGAERTPRHWTVETTDGQCHSMFGINRYAKKSAYPAC